MKVHAAGVNPVDWKTRAGGGMAGLQSMPLILGWDVQYVTAPSRHFARKPRSLTHVEAAALTAWQILIDTANVQPRQKVLVTAAAGGSATWPCRSRRPGARTSSAPPARRSTSS